jgi:NodT family efflux transporter outer membrane factor (OMF) lipoprotein
MRSRSPLLVALLSATLLAGCGIPNGGTTVKPVSSTAVGLTGATAAAIPPAGEWWHAFGDPQFDRIMAEALAGNPTLDQALARLHNAQASIAGARSQLLPQLSGTADETYQRFSENSIIPPPYGGGKYWMGDVTANLDWSLDLAGKQKARIDEARQTALASGLDYEAARVTLSGAVAQAYVNLARAEAQIAIAKRTLASRQQQLSLANTRVRTQLGSEFDTSAAQVLLAEAKQAKVRAEGSRVLMIHALAALAGHGADYYGTIQPTKIDLTSVLPVPTALPADLLGRRADILAARARIDAADAGRREARAEFFPDVDLKAFIGVSSIGLGSLFTGGSLTYGAGPALHLPIFEGGKLRAQYKGATAGEDLATATYNDTVIGAVHEAADALATIDINTRDAAQQARLVAALARNTHLNEVRQASGLGVRLDVLSAGDRQLDADQRQTDIAADGAIARVKLLVAIGGSFDPAALPHLADNANHPVQGGQP